MGNDKKPTLPIWLSYPTTSRYGYPCYAFLIPQLQNLNPLHGICLDWYLIPFIFFAYLFIYFLEKGRNYVSFIVTIIINITALLSHTVTLFRYFMPMIHGVYNKTPPSTSPYLPPSTTFFPGVFIVLQ